jgi:hypothetical protein
MLTGMRTSVGTDDGGGPVAELAAVAEAKRQLSRREEVWRSGTRATSG